MLLVDDKPAKKEEAKSAATETKKDTRLYELRVYTCTEGNWEKEVAFTKDYVIKYFLKHDIKPVGVWVPAEKDTNKLYYMVEFPDSAARDKAWRNFFRDPEWKAVSKKFGTDNGRAVDDQRISNPVAVGDGLFATDENRRFGRTSSV